MAPFGEKYAGSGTSDASFTGQSTDTQNGLYDFLYREYSITQGRWTSPDPAGINAADPANPQTWNRYAYVQNNALSLVDPFGLRDCLPTDDACVEATPMPDDPKKEKVPEVHDYADDLPHMILAPQLHYEMPFRRFPAAPPFLPAKNTQPQKPQDCTAAANAASKDAFDAAKSHMPDKWTVGGRVIVGGIMGGALKGSKGGWVGAAWGAVEGGFMGALTAYGAPIYAYGTGVIQYTAASYGCTVSNNPTYVMGQAF